MEIPSASGTAAETRPWGCEAAKFNAPSIPAPRLPDHSQLTYRGREG